MKVPTCYFLAKSITKMQDVVMTCRKSKMAPKNQHGIHKPSHEITLKSNKLNAELRETAESLNHSLQACYNNQHLSYFIDIIHFI